MNVATEWPAVKLQRVARFIYGESLPDAERDDGDVLVFGSNGAVGTHTKANTAGPVIVIGRKGSHGTVQWSNAPVFAIDTTYFVDQAASPHHLRWLYYALGTMGLDALSSDVGVPGLSRERAYAQPVPLPPLDEQRRIADFLDVETARIDALIAKKRRMIELLHEQWQAHLEHDPLLAVARTVPLRRLASIRGGATPDPSDPLLWDPTGVPWVTIGDMSTTPIVRSTQKSVSPGGLSSARLRVGEPDTVLFAMYGATAGAVARLGIAACWNQALLGLEAHPAVATNGFLELSLLRLQPTLVGLFRSNTQTNLNADQVGSLPITLPSFPDQHAVTARLQETRSRNESAVQKLDRQIELLHERRQAVITAAVTGQITVPV